MGFWSWLVGDEALTRADTPLPSDPSTALTIPPRTAAPRTVAAGDALSLGAVFRAVQVISTSIASLSVDAFRGDERLDPQPLFIRQPDVDEHRPAFLEMTTVSLASQGNAFWRIWRDNQGRISNLQVLNPLDVEIQHTQAGRVTGYQHAGRVLSPEDVRHLKFLRVPGTPRGLGPIQAAQAELRGAIDLRDYAANWFEDSGVPSGLLKSDQPVTKDAADDARDEWDKTPAGRTRVLGSGLDYKAIYLSPRDAQFLESQQFSTTGMARLFGMPSSLMLASIEGNTQTYANISQAWLEFTKFTLAKYYREIEEAFTALLPRGTVARFNLEAFLRAETETRYQTHALALNSGWLSIDEVRAIENLPPLPHGLGGFKEPQPQPEEGADV